MTPYDSVGQIAGMCKLFRLGQGALADVWTAPLAAVGGPVPRLDYLARTRGEGDEAVLG